MDGLQKQRRKAEKRNGAYFQRQRLATGTQKLSYCTALSCNFDSWQRHQYRIGLCTACVIEEDLALEVYFADVCVINYNYALRWIAACTFSFSIQAVNALTLTGPSNGKDLYQNVPFNATWQFSNTVNLNNEGVFNIRSCLRLTSILGSDDFG